MADVGCRNTVFGAEAQVACRYLDQMRRSGITRYRLEFVHESDDIVRRVTAAFAWYFEGRFTAAALDNRLQKIAPQGMTEGSLFVPQEALVALSDIL
jgi:putative protease